jgi:hypothetical protein
MPGADLVNVIDNPGFLGFAFAVDPTPLADRHCSPHE